MKSFLIRRALMAVMVLLTISFISFIMLKVSGDLAISLAGENVTFIEKAAAIKGVSITDFIIQNAVEDATRTIREHERWNLEQPDTELFFHALLRPAAPGRGLKKSARRYRERYLRSE